MKAGEKLRCPHCSEPTVAREKNILSGWKVTGTVLVCPLCGGELGTPEKPGGNSSRAAGAEKLAALLGEVDTGPEFHLEKTEEYGRFCRNCRHFIIHPFQSRCGRTGQDADPMGECGQFELRKETK